MKADTLVDVLGAAFRAAIDGTDDRRGHDARRARGRSADPGRAARGLPARRLAAAPQHGHDRRQPPAGDALLVLAAEVPVLPPRRRPLPREGGPAPRARVLRQRALRVRASRPIRRPRCSRSARRLRTDRRELGLAELYRLPTDDDRATTTLEPGELILELDVPEADVEHLPEGDGPQALGVRARRRRRGAHRRRDADRARGRGADPVAARVAGGARGRDAAARHGVQGRDRARARAARARTLSRLPRSPHAAENAPPPARGDGFGHRRRPGRERGCEQAARRLLPAASPLPFDTPPNPCPVPRDLRDEFRAAATDTDLPLR